jgi:gamma-glutamyltranspeptidase / glutathione hydrolase
LDIALTIVHQLETYPFLLEDPLFSETYAPNGTLVGLGDTIYRKRYARTLEKIAEKGADAFYHGEIATNIASAAWARGGIITTADLANYTAIMRQPANITYRDRYRIWSTVAPSSGNVVLSILNIFQGYNGSAGLTNPAINETTHELIQATRFGYGQRTNMGDPAFTPNVTELEAEFLLPSTAVEIRQKIDNITHPTIYYDAANYQVEIDGGTSHLAVADGNGNAISLTTTVNLYWGSQVMTTDGMRVISFLKISELTLMYPF